MLSVYNINVWYGAIHAIKNVSFDVQEGEIVALIGANGAGKSTTLKTVSGLLRSQSGSINFLGENIMHTPAEKLVSRGLAQVPEGRRIFLEMTVEENLEMGAYTQPKTSVEPGLARVYDAFPRLKERRRQIAGTLSGGEQQMLAMGRALMSNPKLLMLDEPSMGLAPILIAQIFEIIEELNRAGVTILLVEQNAQMALSIASRGYVLETGNVILTGTGQELLVNDDVRKAYLGG
ncbi:ABC transporter ATP-binding protein [Collinsella sp. zg1085]|uniref:ABC transporter ATP-binding protein n=1 Tax=Collinsella sp. zg1085 TaxID=2844380 RepID=UPI001C0CB7D2|nr:ABC transporter ATP-binding protein [Collinsella sp. zg1085]QWT18270.1 ABC transporter ATP-binding protein [Collinsella sp. zg1085]